MYSTFLFIYGYLMLEGPVSNLPEQLPNFEKELVKHLSCVTTQLLLAFCQKLLVHWFLMENFGCLLCKFYFTQLTAVCIADTDKLLYLVESQQK